MQIHYHTKSGSIYVRTTAAAGDIWHKVDADGQRESLAGGMHLTRKRLQQLITDYPVSALDSTVCFGEGVAREFFDDAKRENAVQVDDAEESAIFFLTERGFGQYGIGYSSRVEKVETVTS
ncbi:MAG: hypothetical protein H8E62_11695 [Planctomycetes bacterium]|nr:hypothetical protein [Planctomycetota bacterium]